MLRPTMIAAIFALVGTADVVRAQFELPPPKRFGESQPTKVSHRLVADVVNVVPGKPFKIGILFDVKDNAYFYYKTAGSLGLPTRITWELPAGWTLGATQFPAPEVKHERDELGQAADYYIYTRSTVIFAEVTPPVDLEVGSIQEIRAKVNYQYCDDVHCIPVSDKGQRLALTVAAEVSPSEHSKTFLRASRQVPKVDAAGVVRVEPYLSASAIRPNDDVKLALDLDISTGFHIQMHRPPDDSLVSTEIILETPEGIDFSPPTYPEPLAPIHPTAGIENVKEYRGRITVLVPLRARKFVQVGENASLRGFIRYQACDENGCQPPTYAEFSLSVPVVADGTAVVPSDQGVFAAGDVPLTSTAPAATPAVANAWADKIKPKRTDIAEGSLWWYLVNAFLGGIVLNFMPCVLPVIAIKVLGFANQAGESRGRVLVLNIAYSVGVIAVFVLLASLATLPGLISGWDSAIIGINTLTGMSIPTGNLDWGQLFQLPQFNVAMASIVFAMGLSLLGVFEIPVPGMVGNVQNHREGPMGAFLTGILATLLATPCTGPFMGAALSWSVTQSPAVIYAVWSTIGLGMAFPYILCGIFPKAVAWIPKPGMWMVRLKEFAGFVLMGTVVWIVSYLNITYVLPLLVILLGIAMSLWMISNLYNYSSTSRRKWTVRAFSAAIAVAAVYLASTTIFDVADDRARQNAEDYIARSRLNIDVPAAPANRAELEWVRFTGESLDSALSDGRTVFIDFTANWCNICKVNEAVVLNTEDTKQFFEELGVVAMKADMTNYSPELEEWKTKFGGSGLPHYVVISARDATNPRVFSGPISTDQVQKEIRQVGPSRGFERNAASADAAVMK